VSRSERPPDEPHRGAAAATAHRRNDDIMSHDTQKELGMTAGRILVVDDEESMCQYLSILLEKEGHEVATAQSGAEALGMLEDQPIDVVMTDIQMPRMDGIQLLKGVKAKDPALPVVIMTAYASEQSAIDAVNLGAFSYLQ
jgi:DNA-binding NtrC family response regulator